MMIRALIVDDELAAREILEELIRGFCPGIELVGMAEDTFEADKKIDQLKPDLIFLDVEMPRRSGIDFLQSRSSIDFHVIFTTAYNRYAVDAIKLSALDYLVKPIEIKDLIAAVDKVTRENIKEAQILNLLANEKADRKKIALHHADGIDFVVIDEIVYGEADGSYTNIHLKDGRKMTMSKTLKSYEEPLKSHGFYRSHKSYLVNLAEIVRFDKDGYLNMSNGAKLQISRGKKDEIVGLISG